MPDYFPSKKPRFIIEKPPSFLSIPTLTLTSNLTNQNHPPWNWNYSIIRLYSSHFSPKNRWEDEWKWVWFYKDIHSGSWRGLLVLLFTNRRDWWWDGMFHDGGREFGPTGHGAPMPDTHLPFFSIFLCFFLKLLLWPSLTVLYWFFLCKGGG